MQPFDCIIVGGGPAGVSAALYTLRASRSTLLLTGGSSALTRAELIDNYYGFPEGIPGEQLLQNGLRQAQRLGADLRELQVLKILPGDPIEVNTTGGRFATRALLLATGVSRNKPKGLPLDDFEGRGVSYCAVCDGFFHRNKPVAVLGAGEYAKAEAEELLQFTPHVTVLTAGMPIEADFGRLTVMESPVESLLADGGGPLTGVRFAGGDTLALSGLFVAMGTASTGDLALAAGIVTSGQYVVVDRQMKTNQPGIFAAGDCIGGTLQVATAVGEGAVAGLSMLEHLRKG